MKIVDTKHSISSKLLKYIFFSYCIVAILLTAIQTVVEYSRSKNAIQQTLYAYQPIFEQTLTNAVWQRDLPQLNAALSTILQLPEIVGVTVLDGQNHSLAKKWVPSIQEQERAFLEKQTTEPNQFTDETDLFWHAFEIKSDPRHGPSERLGTVYFYSSRESVIAKVRGVLQTILLFALLQTIVLWGIFLLFGQRLLYEPLQTIINHLVAFFETQTGQPMLTFKPDDDEMNVIKQTVIALSEQLNHATNDLKNGYAKLHIIATIFELSSSRQELSAILQSIVQELVSTVWLTTQDNAIQGGCISLFPINKHHNEIKVFAGMPEDVVSHCNEPNRGGCLCGRSIKRGEILFAPSLHHSEIQPQEWRGESGYYSVPILARADQRTIGVITCLVQGTLQNLEKEKQFLSSIAHAISSLVEHRMTDEESERHQLYLEKTVQERTKQLLHADRLATLGTFSAGMAHEVNNPNTFIQGNVQHLQMFWKKVQPILKRHAAEDTSGQVARFMDEVPATLQDIVEGSQRISGIVDSLKKYSKGGFETDRVVCHLSDPVHDALHLLEPMLKKSQVVLVTTIPADLSLYCDRQQMGQVFVNLINNAIDALEGCRKSPKTIRIRAERLEQHLWVRVIDNGPGVPEEAIGKVFDPFFTTKGKTKGTGLGLSIVHGIVEDHGGQVTLYSAPDIDTEVLMILPIQRLPRKSAAKGMPGKNV